MPRTNIMQNLFSFAQTLSADLFSLSVRLVLLLDIALAAVLSWPLVHRLSRPFAALRRNRLAGAALIFIPVFLIPALALSQSGYLVEIGGQPIGIVAQEDTLRAAVCALESEASSLSEDAYHLPYQVTAIPTRCTGTDFMTAGALESALTERADDLAPLAVIRIDGQRAGVCASAEQAQLLLDRIKAQYATTADSASAFVQAVRVDTVTAPRTLASDFSALYQSLSPRLDVKTTRAVTYTEEIPYETLTQENEQQSLAYHAVVQDGQTGQAEVTAVISTVDGQESGRTEVTRTVLSPATDEIVEIGTKNTGIGTGALELPLTGYVISSPYCWRNGRMHNGVDLAVDEGTPVYAADNGRVILAGNLGDGYGNYVILDHQNGMKTLYAHNETLLVEVGDIVAKGERIALSGNTGNSTGPHLHFEVMVDDNKVDPTGYVAL